MQKKGFTLVEILLVVIILGILAAVALPRFFQARERAMREACNTNVATINSQVELWRINVLSYPSPLSELLGSAEYFPDGTPVCPFTSAYELGTNNRVTRHTHGF